jgi:phosphinothricin acetyltransferase
MNIRPAEGSDAAAIAAIYAHHVEHGFGTFDLTAPDAAFMDAKRADLQATGLPFLVAEIEGEVAGYAYASAFRPRPGYRYTVEDSVYITPDRIGQGVGRALLSAVLEICEAQGFRQAVAVIGDSENAASIGLHRALGFTHSGIGKAFGYKKGRWVDVVWMQKALNGGDASAPGDGGLSL